MHSQSDQNQSEFSFETRRPETFTVTQLTAKVKGLLETEVGTVWVKGEISNYKPSAAGHIYFSLKDAAATLSCAMFRGVRSGGTAGAGLGGAPRFQIKDGMEVLVRGRISVYAPRGNYQLIVEHLEPLGHGALQLAFDQLKAKLLAEGLFDATRKSPIPAHPSRVVLITSPTGAVLQDMLNVLGRRNAGISLLIVPTMVQGEDAPPKICAALRTANEHKLGEVIILARGGGSMEDLWCFNNEDVVRAVAASSLPVISAVGHEVDFTLCDFAADLRAPTPSAAAELVSKNRLELIDSLGSHESRLGLNMANRLGRFRQRLLALEGQMISPVERVNRSRAKIEEIELRLVHAMDGKIPALKQQLDETQVKISHALERKLAERRRRLETLGGTLEALSPLKVLGRGYTLIKDSQTQELLKSKDQARAGHNVDLIFQDGTAKAQIL